MSNRGWIKDLQDLADANVQTLVQKDKEYGSSWKRRGGIGSMMMLARKWDRIENQVKAHNWDIFAALKADDRKDGIKDDLDDLICYILLVRAEVLSWGKEHPTSDQEHPFGYEGDE